LDRREIVRFNYGTKTVIGRWRDTVTDPVGGVEELISEHQVSIVFPLGFGVIENVDRAFKVI
jgi:hypothetical protein